MIGIAAISHSIVDVFTGINDTQNWIRRFEDVLAAQHSGNVAMTDEKKVQALCLYLDGPARECVAEMADVDQLVYNTVKERLQETFETDLSRQVARQKLSICQQCPGESVTVFAEKLRKFVKAVTAGQNQQLQNERLTQEFLDKLTPDISFHVQSSPTQTWAQALNKAQLFESLLASHAANRLTHPTTFPTSSCNESMMVNRQSNAFPSITVDSITQQFADLSLTQNNGYPNKNRFCTQPQYNTAYSTDSENGLAGFNDFDGETLQPDFNEQPEDYYEDEVDDYYNDNYENDYHFYDNDKDQYDQNFDHDEFEDDYDNQ
jgi:hypothetical protein